MMCISFVDLLPEAVKTLGFHQAHIAFYAGGAFFALLMFVLPDPDLDAMLTKESNAEP